MIKLMVLFMYNTRIYNNLNLKFSIILTMQEFIICKLKKDKNNIHSYIIIYIHAYKDCALLGGAQVKILVSNMTAL